MRVIIGVFTAALFAMPGLAHAGDLSVGSATLYDPLQSGRAISAAWRTDREANLNIELRGTYSPDLGENGISDLTFVLVQVADSGSSSVDFQVPVYVDTLMVEALADFAPQRERGRTQVVPHLRVGLGMLSHTLYNATYDEAAGDGQDPLQLSSQGNGVTIPAITELTFELWSLNDIGLRFGAGVVANVRSKAQYDPNEPTTEKELNLRPRLGADFIVSLGGK